MSVGDMLVTLPVWYQLSLAVALGAIWGSFVAALCSRWPRGAQISGGRSRCDSCQKTLTIKDLVPVLSYVLLKGKCRYCGRRIGEGALYIEIASAAIGGIAMLALAEGQAVSAAIFGWLLLPLAILDHQHLWLPNRLILLLALAGLLFGPALTPDISWLDRLMAATLGFLSLETIRQVFKKIRNVDGMGGGDPKLFGALGIWLGWQLLPMILLLSCFLGFAYVFVFRRHGGISEMQLPFGSFLCVGAFAVAVASCPVLAN